MKVMTVPKREQQAALLADWLKRELLHLLSSYNGGQVSSCGSRELLSCKGLALQTIFIANRVWESLEHTSVDERNYVASSNNPAVVSARGISAEVFQSSSGVRDPKFPISKQFPFERNTEMVINIRLGIANNEIDNTNKSVDASAIKSVKERPINYGAFLSKNSMNNTIHFPAVTLP